MPRADDSRTFLGKAKLYAELARLHRPIGIYLLLWPTLWALWFAAGGVPDARILLIFIAGVVLMRSAGCVINDYADRELDALVERTRGRPLADGRVRPGEALALFGALAALAFALVLLTNRETVLMSFVALALAASYPFMKRIHPLPQAHLGLAFGWAIPMAWVAQMQSFPPLSIWTLYAANTTWVVAYDTMYAMADRDDDVAAGIRSSAILFGAWDRRWIGALQAATLALLFAAGRLEGFGLLFNAGLAAAAGLALYQQRLLGQCKREPRAAACLAAFANNGYFGLVVFAGLLAETAARPPI